MATPNSSKTSKTNPSTSVGYQFIYQLLDAIQAPRSDGNVQFFAAQMTAENTSAQNNPLATTLKYNGSYALPGNPDGVQQYKSFEDGVTATAQTLLGGGYYTGLVSDLRNGSYSAEQLVSRNASEINTWGTGAGSVAADIGSAPSQTAFGGPTAMVPANSTNISRTGGIAGATGIGTTPGATANQVGNAVRKAENTLGTAAHDTKDYIMYGGAFAGGMVLILLGLFLIGADIGLNAYFGIRRGKTQSAGESARNQLGEPKQLSAEQQAKQERQSQQDELRQLRLEEARRRASSGHGERVERMREQQERAKVRTQRARARKAEGRRPTPKNYNKFPEGY